jgi:hypothetical protein
MQGVDEILGTGESGGVKWGEGPARGSNIERETGSFHEKYPQHEADDEEEPEELRQREQRHPDDAEDWEGEIPHNAREGGMGGATKVYGDRRRGARDSRLVAMDAQDSFKAMFPGVSRIKPATSFR